MSYERDFYLQLEVSIKLPHHTLGLSIIQILSLTLPLPRHALALHREIPLLKTLAEPDHKIIHQISVQLLKVTDQAWRARHPSQHPLRPISQNIHQDGDRQPPLPRMVPSKHRPRDSRRAPIHHNQVLQDSTRRKHRDGTTHHLAPAHSTGLPERVEASFVGVSSGPGI